MYRLQMLISAADFARQTTLHKENDRQVQGQIELLPPGMVLG